ncbi:MAG: aspartate aminotransferase family protein [Chloroflexi bacterium]|nr:aspartate aminotransferase family protein [Chloroflexota bacterium]MQC48398.1 aspartate aminotransferase family protein [Chloroflexota bacterium]
MAVDQETYEALAREDLAHLLHPQYFAPDHQEPVIFDSGQGVWLTDVRGRQYIDGLSSLWNVAVGHGRGELADAAAEQIRKVAFTNNYVGYSNVPAIKLASKVVDLAYDNMGGVFFTNSGSESNEGALKVARFYWNLQGRSGKVKLIARERAYHGGTLATSSMTGLPPFWKYFGPLVPEIVHASKPDNLECDCVPNSDGECAHWIEAAIQRESADTVAAIICEPVKGAGGVWTPSDDYFPRLREICDRYEVLLIADEVITGFGRTGYWFALERWGVQPDILSIAKAITSGYIPLGAFIVSKKIHEALKETPPDARFMHAYTNSAHPTAAAVALRNLQIMEDEGLVQNAAVMGERLGEGLQAAFDGHPHVTNLRHLGLMAGFSVVADASTAQAYEASRGTGLRIQTHLREVGGVITRIVGDNVLFAPPLVVNASEVDQIVRAASDAVAAVSEG